MVWLQADAIVGLNDTDPVATWLDSSGNGNNATQGVAADRPIYRTNIVNGKPIVRFDGASDFLEAPYAASLNNANFQFWSAVFRTNNTAAQQMMCWQGDPLANGFGVETEIHMGVADFFTPGDFLDGYLGRLNPNPGSTVAFNDTVNFHVLSCQFTALTTAAPTVQIFVDGAAGPLITGTLAENFAVWTGTTRLGRPGAATRFYNGDLAEVLVYEANMASQRALVENYLASKYGL